MRTRLYGLSIELNRDIDGLPRVASAGPADLRIEFGSRPESIPEEVPGPEALWYVGPHIAPDGQPELSIFRLPDGGPWIRYADGVSFRIDRSLESIQGWWLPPRELGDALGYLLGPVLGLLLRLRGRVCMHAGGVVIQGSALLFMGAEGAGKSTTTAALVQRGHRFLTDDIAPLHETPDGFVVQPGVPRIFLEPGSIRALDVAPGHVRRQSSTWDKSFLPCLPEDPNWANEGFPLKALYLLKRDDRRQLPAVCQPLTGFNAMTAIVAQTYARRTLDAHQRADEFQFVSRLLERVRVVEVHFPEGLNHLDDVCRRIEEDAAL
jgi:hypothetical protein